MNERVRTGLVVVTVLAVSFGMVAPFTVEAGTASPEPVAFEETVSVGLTLADERDLEEEVALPRAQAFYSQYEYVVGYYGVETFVDSHQQEGHQRRFGHPLAVYVTDYGDTGVELTERGYPAVDRSPQWVAAAEGWYVVGSDARTPAGETVMPFSDRADAERFADAHGGEVRSWDQLLGTTFEREDAATVRDRVADRHAVADRLRDRAEAHEDRPVSVVVGEDVDTVQAGVDAAPPNTTVLVGPGTYEETVEVDRPITLAGTGDTTIRGDGNGSVVTITEPGVGVRNLAIDGVGSLAAGAERVPGPESESDDAFQAKYAGADAGISAHVAAGVSIANVRIEAPANGIILRESPDAVVHNVTVEVDQGTGYAAVMALRSPGLVQNSTFVGGRDTVYLYRSDGMVVRENAIQGGVLGVHTMHTSEMLLADNRVQDARNTGIFVMTGPEHNAIVGNHISDSAEGAYLGGADSYVAENVFEANGVGLEMEAHSSIYEHNAFVANDVGVEAAAVLPTNRVVGNDFLDNADHATAGPGPLRIWSHDREGNYWHGTSTRVDERRDRPYSPTDTVDRRLHTTDGAATLAHAPALDALAGLRATVPGMQTGSITDLSPSREPNNPALLEETAWADERRPRDRTQTTTP